MSRTNNIEARPLSAALLTAALVAMVLGANGPQSQGRTVAGPAGTVAQRDRPNQSTFDVLMSPEEKRIRDVYARLMRYHTAARDALAATEGVPAAAGDYVTFELRDIHSGPIEEISGVALPDVVTIKSGNVLKVTPHHVALGDGPRHGYYDVEWDTAVDHAVSGDQGTVGEMLGRIPDKQRDVTRYTSYEVTVKLRGRQRAYRALALHRTSVGSLGKPDTEILDNVTPEMNTVLTDESPRVITPWDRYTKSPLYQAVVEAINDALERGDALIPANAPIGYLPGDDAPLGHTPRRPAVAKASIRAMAEVSAVNYIQNWVAPWDDGWGAMKPISWTVDIDAEYFCECDCWFAVVSRADSQYNIFYRLLPDVSEASVGAATQANYCKMISDLSSLAVAPDAQWYMVEAVQAHEMVHVAEWKSALDPQFLSMKQGIESLTVPNKPGMTADQAKAAIKALAQYSVLVSTAIINANDTFSLNADRDARTDAAEHAVVDPVVAGIQSKATTKNWPPCP